MICLKYIICLGLDTAECYDIRTGEWRTISNMSTRRSSVGVGVVNGTLFLHFAIKNNR